MYHFDFTCNTIYPTPPHAQPTYTDVHSPDLVNSYANSPITPISDLGEVSDYAGTPNICYLLDGMSASPSHFMPAQTLHDDCILISTTFHPGTHPPPNTIFSSSDNVFFYVILEVILQAAPTAFQPYLSLPLSHPQYRNMVITVDAPSSELNVIMHAIYKTSPASHSPDFDTLLRSVDRMPQYGLSPAKLIDPITPLFEILLSHAPLHPLEVYALAAHHKIHPLAETVSSHLLSHNLASVTDGMAERIGPLYLNRLFLLHVERFAALRGILLSAPHPHAPTSDCGFEDQSKLTRAWALVAAYLVWDAKPDLSTNKLAKWLNPLLEHITCASCKQALRGRIKDVMVQWTSVKRTI